MDDHTYLMHGMSVAQKLRTHCERACNYFEDQVSQLDEDLQDPEFASLRNMLDSGHLQLTIHVIFDAPNRDDKAIQQLHASLFSTP